MTRLLLACLAACAVLLAGPAWPQAKPEVDLNKARAAAEKGNPKLQYSLGMVLMHGEGGLAKDPVEGVKWLRRAAEQRYADAQLQLGLAYHAGNGVAKDIAAALDWIQKSAAQNSANAAVVLASIYLNGEGVPKDIEQGMRWTRKAADLGHVEAKVALDKFEAAKAQEAKAAEGASSVSLLRKLAEAGDAASQGRLAVAYLRGKDVEQNFEQAAFWSRKAAEQGLAYSQYNLAIAYYDGRGVAKDHRQALEWYRKAALQDYKPAKGKLGLMYYHGYGTPKDSVEGLKWLLLGEQAGDPDAARNRKGLEGTLTPAALAEAKKRAQDWKPLTP